MARWLIIPVDRGFKFFGYHESLHTHFTNVISVHFLLTHLNGVWTYLQKQKKILNCVFLGLHLGQIIIFILYSISIQIKSPMVCYYGNKAVEVESYWGVYEKIHLWPVPRKQDIADIANYSFFVNVFTRGTFWDHFEENVTISFLTTVELKIRLKFDIWPFCP